MKVMIDITESAYKKIITYPRNELEIAIWSGTPIPDNATVGEVFCILTGREPICDTASYFTIDKELWDSPYQKERTR